MGIITSKRRLQGELRNAFSCIDTEAVVLHTDLLRIGFVNCAIPLEQQGNDFFSMLVKVSEGHVLLFPTFNYDFCQTGVYNVLDDPCQVGTLNECIRLLYPHQRTLTPIFNFCIYENHSFSLEPVVNPFSIESTFGQLVQRGATVVFLGALFTSNTFIHYVEEMMDIEYRYLKPFPGIIRQGDTERPIVVRYRVRPLVNGVTIDYDWERLFVELLTKKIIHTFPLGNGRFLCYRVDHLLKYWCERLEEDSLYLLTPQARKKVKDLYRFYGRPLQYESLEKGVRW